jgi:histone H3/H4
MKQRNTIHNRRDTLPNKSNTKQEHNKRNTIQGTQYQEQYNEHNKRKTIVGTQ